MRAGYKIILIGICTYFGVLFTLVIASNVYCDFISQEICTFRITSVALPPFNTISSSNSSDDECYFENDTGKVIPIKRPRIEVIFRKFSEHAVPGTNPEFRNTRTGRFGSRYMFYSQDGVVQILVFQAY